MDTATASTAVAATASTNIDQTFDATVTSMIEAFHAKCINSSVDVIRSTVNRAVDDLREKFANELKSNIARITSGNHLSDSSYIISPARVIFEPDQFKVLRDDIESVFKMPQPVTHYAEFTKRHHREQYPKEVWFVAAAEPNGVYDMTIVLISEYGKIVRFKYNDYHCRGQFINYDNLNFKIPIDYVNVITLMTDDMLYKHTCLSVTPNIANIIDTMLYIKEELFNRRIIPLYVRPIIEENRRLKAEHVVLGPQIDTKAREKELDDLARELEQTREKLRRAAIKLELDRRQFIEEKGKITNAAEIVDSEFTRRIREGAIESCYICMIDTAERAICGHSLHKHCCARNNNTCPLCQ